ncbi:MAG: type II toxin-antitoxin system YafQ family toxin [Betaproteobacteria bacterium]
MASKTSAPRKSGHTKQFVKDWRRLKRSGRYPMQELEVVMRLLTESRDPLPPQYLDHPLKGEWKDFRDCHIRGDWLLIYRITETADGEEVIFTRTGSHAELFE